jgi:hypothetical protein
MPYARDNDIDQAEADAAFADFLEGHGERPSTVETCCLECNRPVGVTADCRLCAQHRELGAMLGQVSP